jgi:enoyl-CoA hydratase
MVVDMGRPSGHHARTMSYAKLDRPRPHIALLTLNRPERFNAISYQALRELYAVLDELESDLDTRVVIMTGAGRGFCSGFDLKAAAEGENGPWEEGLGEIQNQYRMQQAYGGLVVRLRKIPQPLIAAVNGAAAGGGLSVALACDLRIAAPEAKFNCAFTRIGLGGGEMGSSYFLPKLLGSAMAAELMYTGRMVSAEEALQIGLVSRVVEPDRLLETALELAQEMVDSATPFGLRITKEVIEQAQSGMSLEAVVQIENRNQVLAGRTKDASAAGLAWTSQQKPSYGDE